MRKPSPGGIPTALAKRLRGVRYAVGDVVFVVGRAAARLGRALIRIPVAIGSGIAGFWRSLSVIARRRLVAAAAVAVGLLILFSAVVPNLPCQFPGGDSCPPTDDAAELVPADALVYVHANLDPETDQYESVAELAADLPVLSEQIVARAPGLIRAPGGDRPDFEADVAPLVRRGGRDRADRRPRPGSRARRPARGRRRRGRDRVRRARSPSARRRARSTRGSR